MAATHLKKVGSGPTKGWNSKWYYLKKCLAMPCDLVVITSVSIAPVGPLLSSAAP